jgi:hypothetical protein
VAPTPKPGYDFSSEPPKEALEWFRSKGYRIGFDHRDVWREEHARAFTVAKAMEVDVLRSIRDAVDRALGEGRTFRDFAKDLRPELERLGWWGRKEMTDPVTGQERSAQLGSPRRLRVIYRTNMRTARAAGQWDRIQRTRKTHPYLLYQLGPSQRHRPEHVAWVGTLLPADDPWWGTHYPPNGWGCKCHVRQVSRAEAERLKGQVRTEAPQTRTREWVNRRTGEVSHVPEGIDPGWDYNPGAAGRMPTALDHLSRTLQDASPEDAAASIRELVGGPLFAEWAANPSGAFPAGMLKAADAKAIGAKARVAKLSDETMRKQVKRHPELKAAEYSWIQSALERGQRRQDSERSAIYVLEQDGYVAVVKATQTGEGVFVTSFRRLSRQQVKRDEELARIAKKEK